MYGRGSTNIDDLLDLDDPSDGSEGFSNRNVGSYTNAIRSKYAMGGNAIDSANRIKQQRQVENYQHMSSNRNMHFGNSGNFGNSYNSHNRNIGNRYTKEKYSPYSSYEPYEDTKSSNNNISCQDVLKHISNCSICSKFYNNDRTVYIIIIIILIILCLLLVKKVLNV